MPTLNYATPPKREPIWWPIIVLLLIPLIIQPTACFVIGHPYLFQRPVYDSGSTYFFARFSLREAFVLISLIESSIVAAPSILGLLFALPVIIRFRRRPRGNPRDVEYLFMALIFIPIYIAVLLGPSLTNYPH